MKRFRWAFVLLIAFALIASACSSDSDDTTTTAAGGDGGGSQEVDLSGTEVSIFGAFAGIEADAVNAVIEEKFNVPTGSNAVYEGSDSFEEQIKIRVEGGNPPDVAIYPQPGSVIEQAAAGTAIALEDLGFTVEELEATFGTYLVGLGEYEGKHYGIPTNVNMKTMVWYNKTIWDANAYEVPTTFDELKALSALAVADGVTPWCVGFGSDAATGWPGTDWIEDIMLGSAGVDAYDRWVTNDLKFQSPEVKHAFELAGEIWFTEGYVLGGADQIAAIDFRDAPTPLFNDTGGCLMHRQASFITNFFPEDVEANVDYGVFAFPGESAQGALIAGELAAVFNDRPEVRAWIANFISEDTQCAQGAIEGVQRISPNVNVSTTCYSDAIVATAAGAISQALIADTARFDASDLMPSAVGSGSFWTGMINYTRDGASSIDDVLNAIDASWPTE
jgi:alpha-glucoside transport system substrate-binding protein